MADTHDIRGLALRIRHAIERLTDPDEVAAMHDYVAELELLAAEQEAEDALLKARALR